MKREELKAYNGASIYRVLECNPHNDDELQLEKIFIEKEEFKFYEKSEADKVFDDYEQRIKELESQLENVQNTMYTENVDANMALVKANERIKELEAEAKKWKQDNRYLSAFVHLLYKGKDANSTAIIDVANRIDKLEEENKRLRYTLLRIQRVL